MSANELLYAPEVSNDFPKNDPWVILIVDDDLEVHSITKLALHDFIYDRRGLLFLSAYSAAEATSIFETREDIALVLLDVVMETDTAGLDFAKVVRERFRNDQVRIIIRTGQPGISPERYVIDHYDINDYKEKTELTADRLYTVIRSSLSQYKHIMELENKTKEVNEINQNLESRIELRTRQLREAKKIAEDSTRSKSEFLAMMSHEIRTPMNGVLGMLELLDSSELNTTHRNYVHVAQSSTTSLLNLINDILDFSKIEAGKMDLEMLEFDLEYELDIFVKSIAFKTEEKGLKLILNTDNITHRNIIADPGRLRQILTNLVGNAVKFTHKGQIEINVALYKENETHGHLRIDVTDTGIGIPADKLETLFEAFIQADGSTTREYGGTGLGLSITKNLCNLMDGSIGVKSTLGEGSTFSVDLQVKLGGDQIILVNQTVASDDQEAWPASARILVVDDNDVNLLVAQSYLETFGLNVDVASRGMEAIELIKNASDFQPYTLVLMDCLMPEMDGYETTSQIRLGRAADANKQIPIIAMTANAMSGDREKCILSGMDDYMTKPVTKSSLRAVLRKWILKDKHSNNHDVLC